MRIVLRLRGVAAALGVAAAIGVGGVAFAAPPGGTEAGDAPTASGAQKPAPTGVHEMGGGRSGRGVDVDPVSPGGEGSGISTNSQPSAQGGAGSVGSSTTASPTSR